MKKAARMSFSSNSQHDLAKILRELGARHGMWSVFRDFVEMCACTISNSIDFLNYEVRETQYMNFVGKYSKAELDLFSVGFGHVMMGLEIEGHHDMLGQLFMGLEMGDAWRGQFFTPYHVCLMMAKMQLGDGAKNEIQRKGFITVVDPCTGGGAMLIAAAHALLDEGINYQQHMHAYAMDIDIVAVHMTYIQLSLLHVPAIVYHGNSLTDNINSTWKTPAHVIGFWGSKLCNVESSSSKSHTVQTVETTEICQPHKVPEMPISPITQAINLRAQLDLF